MNMYILTYRVNVYGHVEIIRPFIVQYRNWQHEYYISMGHRVSIHLAKEVVILKNSESLDVGLLLSDRSVICLSFRQ